ncbi:MAG: isoprenylcysteine carboxylmethyltransferase family protein [Nitrospirae bacterium]|nr:isoprenylcysteine carboxylmethyltransferase family protein [Nitrospirota bacterium]
MNKNKAVLSSAIVLYFVICLEILIMISPFAGLFYSVFNPFLLETSKYPATRWLSSFFLPHMVVPPDDFLKSIRIIGSVLFVGGIFVFLTCAIQVYVNKFFRKGAVSKGLYSFIRHPQYLGLGITGIGLSILWPRFLVAVLWLVMILIYYFLSRDEERRMLKEHPTTYREYMEKTGMFLPKNIEDSVSPSTILGKITLFVLIAVVTIGGAFFLRDYTIRHLPLWADTNVVALAVLPDDLGKMEHRMADILNIEEVKTRLKNNDHYLVYFLPPNYIMQGLIADTGGEWKLYKHEHTVRMFADWIIHPFSHLKGGHHAMHGSEDRAGHNMTTGVGRRLIFLRVDNVTVGKPYDVFSISAGRTPEFVVDMDIHNLTIHGLKELPKDTGWGKVPTPIF